MATETVTRMTPKAATEYFADLPVARKITSGDLAPGPWFAAEPGSTCWGTRGIKAKPGQRGLTVMDLDAAEGGNTAPEVAAETLHSVADAAEVAFGTWFMMPPSTVESMSILAGDGVEHIEKGLEIYRYMWNRAVTEYLNRCERAGFKRRERCLLPDQCPV